MTQHTSYSCVCVCELCVCVHACICVCVKRLPAHAGTYKCIRPLESKGHVRQQLYPHMAPQSESSFLFIQLKLYVRVYIRKES